MSSEGPTRSFWERSPQTVLPGRGEDPELPLYARPAWQSNHKRVEGNRGLVVGLGILILAALT